MQIKLFYDNNNLFSNNTFTVTQLFTLIEKCIALFTSREFYRKNADRNRAWMSICLLSIFGTLHFDILLCTLCHSFFYLTFYFSNFMLHFLCRKIYLL